MTTFWCVTSTFDDRGHVIANITEVQEVEEKPESACVHTLRKDVYTDWFESWKDANQFVLDARRA